MLQAIRDKTSGWIATAILGFVGLLLVPFGVSQYDEKRSANYVAKIEAPPSWWTSAPSWWPVSMLWEHEEVTPAEFSTAFQRARQQQRAQQGEAFDAREFESAENKREILDILISQRVQKLAARNAGVVVSDAM